MSLADAFNACKTAKTSDHTLTVTSDGFRYRYDFALRQQTVWFTTDGEASWKAFGTVPFSQLDREVLELARNKLIDLGGKPPELAREEPSAPQKGALKL